VEKDGWKVVGELLPIGGSHPTGSESAARARKKIGVKDLNLPSYTGGGKLSHLMLNKTACLMNIVQIGTLFQNVDPFWLMTRLLDREDHQITMTSLVYPIHPQTHRSALNPETR